MTKQGHMAARLMKGMQKLDLDIFHGLDPDDSLNQLGFLFRSSHIRFKKEWTHL